MNLRCARRRHRGRRLAGERNRMVNRRISSRGRSQRGRNGSDLFVKIFNRTACPGSRRDGRSRCLLSGRGFRNVIRITALTIDLLLDIIFPIIISHRLTGSHLLTPSLPFRSGAYHRVKTFSSLRTKLLACRFPLFGCLLLGETLVFFLANSQRSPRVDGIDQISGQEKCHPVDDTFQRFERVSSLGPERVVALHQSALLL